MTKMNPSDLMRAIESKHSCRAGLVESVVVKMTFAESTIWEGVVHVFDLAGHPKANQAYAWTYPIAGTDRCRLFSKLHLPPVTSPAEAVRAAVTAESKAV